MFVDENTEEQKEMFNDNLNKNQKEKRLCMEVNDK